MLIFPKNVGVLFLLQICLHSLHLSQFHHQYINIPFAVLLENNMVSCIIVWFCELNYDDATYHKTVVGINISCKTCKELVQPCTISKAFV